MFPAFPAIIGARLFEQTNYRNGAALDAGLPQACKTDNVGEEQGIGLA